MKTIITKDNKSGRTIETEIPNCLKVKSLKELQGFISDEIILKLALDQAVIKFRAYVRNKLSAKLSVKKPYEKGNFKYLQDDILAEDFTSWIPTVKRRQTKEEKAKNNLQKLLSAGYTKEQILDLLS